MCVYFRSKHQIGLITILKISGNPNGFREIWDYFSGNEILKIKVETLSMHYYF